ncbi:TolC family protein [Maribellus comscasis]|uniref:TolC family protein n=1 Tax=Maribellus comscasis TaxID=2681766 RepID=A0A6I6JWV0_9BACT|nr:TolC family protein [Maribellus comscasis]QGY43603.1 TolC family protein [Maribellus comscasis]
MRKFQLILFILLSGIAAGAQQMLSLDQAIGKALENNYQIEIILNQQRIAEIENNWGDAGRYPYINLSLGDNNSFNMPETENYTTNRFSGDANISWTLFDGFSVKINKQRFEELEELSRKNTAIVVESTIQSVILAYYSVLLEKEKLEAYKEVMQLSDDRYQQAKDRKEFGTYVTYDVLQAQNSYLSDRSDYLLQEVAYKNALRDLNYLMADEASVAYTLTDSFRAIPIDYSLADLEAQMVENNKSLQNQYINQRLLENAVASAKSAFSPSLGFSGGLSGASARTAYVNSGTNWSNSASFYGNFTLSFNLFSGGSRKRALQIAKIDEETGIVEIDEMTHDLKNSLSNVYEYYLVRKELLSVAEENLAAARLNLQISREKFESGAINSFNFRDVQIVYLNAALTKLEAVYNFIDTHTSLLQLTGTIIQEYE